MGLHVILARIDACNASIWLTGLVLDHFQHELRVVGQVSTESVVVVYVLLNSRGQFFGAIENLWNRVNLLEGVENIADAVNVARGALILATRGHPDCEVEAVRHHCTCCF